MTVAGEKVAPAVCNLYSLTRPRDAVAWLFRVPPGRAAAFEPRAAIFPGNLAPVIRIADDGERELTLSSWGFVLLQTDRAPRRVANVRDDKARTSPFWRDSFARRRCLVPASSFSEPKGERPAVWHWFALTGNEARPVFAFAGLWRRWQGPVKKDGPAVDLDVFSILTTAPNALVGTINHERMPVLLNDERDYETWLRGTPEDAFALARSFPAGAMRIVAKGGKEDLGAAGASA